MRYLGLTLGLLLTSCIDVGTTRCGAVLCPPGLVCAAQQDRCVLQEQNDVCNGSRDGEACTFGASTGVCDLGTCLEYRCGNGILETGEVCDDGNGRSGDGCSNDCFSDESCGNGIIDFAAGEMCDDGNTEDRDGCQGNCALARCGDGIRDEGEVCDDGNFIDGDRCNSRCTSDESCGNSVVDVAAGEGCDDGALVDGDGCSRFCVVEFCGNNVIDPGEACDDGNNLSGDGCSGGCTSNETCGNNAIDPSESELCDDGNLRSGDGCSSHCDVELPTWSPPSPNQARRYGRTVFDGNLGAPLIFGGEVGAGEGASRPIFRRRDEWAPLNTNTLPQDRIGHVAVFDVARQETLVFGGRTPVTYMGSMQREGRLLSDAFVLAGREWTSAATVSARAYAAAAYDVANERVVMFGGEDGELLDETWIYDGAWMQLTPAQAPSARARHGMAYDIQRGVMVLYGGLVDGVALTDTWEFDGSEWNEISVAGPPVRGELVYDVARNRTLLFGGSGNIASNELWAYDGTSWSPIVAEGPEPRLGASVGYDPTLGGLIARGGAARAPGTAFDETWLFTDEWTLLPEAEDPPTRRNAASVYDPRDESIHVFGGEFGGPINDSWTFEHTGLVSGEALPFSTLVTAAVYDRARRQIVTVTGGSDDTELHTWIHDGRRWHELPIPGPPLRNTPGLAYDSNRQTVVLFGGRNGRTRFNDLWEFDGNWREVDDGPPPPPARAPLLAYDSRRGVLACAPLGMNPTDLWEFSEGEWTLSPTELPAEPSRLLYYAHGESLWILSAAPPLISVWSLGVNDAWSPVRAAAAIPARAGAFAVMNLAEKTLTLGLGDPDQGAQTLRVGQGSAENCMEDNDRDRDGVSQCADPDCSEQLCSAAGERCFDGACQCEYSVEIACGDGFDDDCDGLVDCDDSDCATHSLCLRELDCTDGSDDDGDGYADCADPGCATNPVCQAQESRCADGMDNDGDGLSDCSDPNCYLRPCLSVLP